VPQIIRLLDSESGKQVASHSHRVIRNRKWLIIAPAQQTEAAHIVIEADDTEVAFGGGNLKFLYLPVNKIEFRKDNPLMPVDTGNSIAYLDARKVTYPLMLRKFKPGDYFYPLGMPKKKKLARFMIDARLSKTAKENVWIIESEKKIAWAVDLRIDDRFKLTAATKEVLLITFTAG
jgi:tRNA(Ile)-lysidine synthase